VENLSAEVGRIIPPAVLELAHDMLMAQGSIPDSPGVASKDGRLLHCAAAAIAAAGARCLSNTYAQDLLNQAIREQAKQPMREAFESLGWPPTLCAAILIQNDETPLTARLLTMTSLIDDALVCAGAQQRI
jgi:hypothetical protein